MRFIVKDKVLETDDGELIKEFNCPLEKRWDDLLPWANHWRDNELNDRKRQCGACQKAVVNLQHYREIQIIALVEVNPEVCGYLRADHPDLTEIVGDLQDDLATQWVNNASSSCIRTRTTKSGERVVKTARSLLALQEAVDQDYRPYFVPNIESGRIGQKLSIAYDGKTRQLCISGDFRTPLPFDQRNMDEQFGKGAGLALHGDFDRPSSPLAAYLLPQDIRMGERVFLEDLIEDRVGSSWNQGDTYREQSGFAIWRGDHLELEQGEDERSGIMFLG